MIKDGYRTTNPRLCRKSVKLTARCKQIFLLPVKFFRNASPFVFVCILKVISRLSLHHVRQTAVSNLCSRTSFRLSQHEKFSVVYLGNEISLTVYLSITDSFFLWGSQRKWLIYVDAIFVSVVAPMLYTLSLLARFNWLTESGWNWLTEKWFALYIKATVMSNCLFAFVKTR